MSEFIAKQGDAKAKAWHEAKALIESVEARGGVWSGEDEKKYADLTAVINRANELIELEQREAKVADAIQNASVDFQVGSVSDSETDILRTGCHGRSVSAADPVFQGSRWLQSRAGGWFSSVGSLS